MWFNVKHCSAFSVSILLLLSLNACAPSQATHYSGQIGRFCEDGMVFTVPMVNRASNLASEDSFWELRRGIGHSVVIALAPLSADPNAPRFRSNMTLTKTELDNPSIDAQAFAQTQLEQMKKDLKGIEDIQQGTDSASYWISFSQKQNGLDIQCKAWFFVRPPQSQDSKALGCVLLGSALKDGSLADTMDKFQEIAQTFSFDKFRSGFIKHAESLKFLGDKLSEATSAAGTPVPKSETKPTNSASSRSTSKASTVQMSSSNPTASVESINSTPPANSETPTPHATNTNSQAHSQPDLSASSSPEAPNASEPSSEPASKES